MKLALTSLSTVLSEIRNLSLATKGRKVSRRILETNYGGRVEKRETIWNQNYWASEK